MFRWLPLALLVCVAGLSAQTTPPAPPPPPKPELQKPELQKERKPQATSEKEEIPPEEDASIAKDDVSFNPLQSSKEITAGDYYFRKHSYLAAANRYRNATKFNEGNAEAWLKLGESTEKLKDHKAAREAYTKYLEVASDAKNASEIRRKLEKLK
jgi:tetratricopeptide (TPR) repeat protein